MIAPHLGRFCRLTAAACIIQTAAAFSPSVSPSKPKVGLPITVTFKINDPLSLSSDKPRVPERIDADGISLMRVEMTEKRFGGYNYLRVTYSGTPSAVGTYRIPSKTFTVGGKSHISETRTFRVIHGAGPATAEKPLPDFLREAQQFVSAPQQPATPSSPRPVSPQVVLPPASSSPTPIAAVAKATLEVQDGEVFVGQAVPVVLKFPLASGDSYDSLIRPVLLGDGFSATGFEELPTSSFVSNGVEYNLVTLTSTIVPFRAGSIKINDLDLKGRRLVAGGFKFTGSGRFPGASGGGWEKFTISAPGREITAVELPEEGRPAHFTGAVGKFSVLPLEVSPGDAKEGEPVTLKAIVRGEENLSSMSPPRLIDAGQWRVHGPREELGADGKTKIFEFTLFARSEQKRSPSASLVYFDPAKKEYLTLRWPSVPLYAAGPDKGKGFTAVAQSPHSSPMPAPPEVATTSSAPVWLDLARIPWDRLRYILLLFLSLLIFTPLFLWATRLLFRRRREADTFLKAALSDAWDNLEFAGENPSHFYTAAAGIISARIALRKGKKNPFDDADAQLNRLVSNVPLREELMSILSRRDELNYGADEKSIIQPGERAAVRAALEKFCEDVV